MSNQGRDHWAELFSLIANAAGGAVAKQLVGMLVEKLVDTQDEELKLLKEIHADIRSLIDGPFLTATMYLEEAKQTNDFTRRLDYLDRAKHKYIESIGVGSNYHNKSLAAFNVATINLISGEGEAASLRWFEKSYEFAIEHLPAGILKYLNDWDSELDTKGVADYFSYILMSENKKAQMHENLARRYKAKIKAFVTKEVPFINDLADLLHNSGSKITLYYYGYVLDRDTAALSNTAHVWGDVVRRKVGATDRFFLFYEEDKVSWDKDFDHNRPLLVGK
jgi:hypothetical protein